MEDFKPNYGSKSGGNVYVSVAVPLIANPAPQASYITWFGPTRQLTISSIVSQQSAIYKHLVTSSIPVQDPNSFGNYTMMFNGESIVTVIISAEGITSKWHIAQSYTFFNAYKPNNCFDNDRIVSQTRGIRKGSSIYKF